MRTQPEWSNKVWARLCAVQSPWLDQVAVLALTGCRPQEVFGAKVELAASGELVFLIQGAKTDAHKGQPWRKLTLRADRPEFTYLIERFRSSGALTLPLHQKLSDLRASANHKAFRQYPDHPAHYPTEGSHRIMCSKAQNITGHDG